MEEYLVAFFHILAMGLQCPDCGGPVGLLCQYHRHPIMDGVSRDMLVQRVECKNEKCGHTHAVLPDFLVPRKHYAAAEVEKVGVAAEKIATDADVSTVHRWYREFREKVGEFAVRLRHIASTVFDQYVNVLPPSSSGVLSQLKDGLRFLPEIPSSSLLGNVYQWLTIPLRLAT